MKKVYSFLTALLVAMLLIPSQLNAQILSANFDDGTLPEGWVVEGNAGSYNWQPTTSYRYGDSGSGMFFNSYYASDGATAILKSPVFSLKDVTKTQMLKFVAYYYDDPNAVYNVCISTDGGSTYPTVLANLHTQEESKWIEYEISLAEYAGQENLCIVFDCVGDWYGRHAFDNFEISPAPTCAKAKDLQAIDIKQTYATLTWKLVEGAGAFAKNFAIKVTPVGEEEPYEYTAENLVADENGVYSYTIEEGELEPGVAHKFSVQGLCGAEDVAAVVESGVFYTACDVADLPIEIDLRTAEVDPFFPCWSHNGTVSYLGQSYASISGDYYGDSFYMVSPQLNQAANNIEVELEYSTYSASGFTYGVASSSDMSDFEELGHIAFDSESGTVIFNTAESTSADLNKVVVFKFDNTDPNIQSIIIREKPCCPKPMGVTVSVIDSANVSLSWSGVAEKFNVVWTDTLSGQSYNAEVTEKTYIIEGLKSATTYSFAVQAVNTSCPVGEQASEFSKTLYATTNCGVRDEAKFVEDFSYKVSYESVLPECWSESVEGLWEAYGSSGYEANYITFREGYLEDGVNSALLVTQPINIVTGGQYDVKFKMNRLAIECAAGVGHLNVYVNSAPSLEGATLLGTVNRSYKQVPTELAAGWYDYSFNIPATVTGTTYIIFEGNKWEGYGSNIINLDDIAVVDAVACRKVTNLAFGEPTTNSIALTWEAEEGQAAWTVEYVVLKGEEVIVDTTSVPVTEKAYTFASLPSSSTLTINGSIVANCDAENNSEKVEFSWTFQTDCDAVTLNVPFTEGFNTRDLPLCWLAENTSGSTSYKWSTNSGSSYQFPGSGEGCAYLSSNSNASTAILTTPELVFEEETDYRIEFFAYRYEYAPTGHGIYVYLSDDPTNTEDAELLTYIPTLTSASHDADVDGGWFSQEAVGSNGMYRIRMDFNTTTDFEFEEAVAKYIIFEGVTTGNSYSNAIDELWIGEKPAVDRIYDFQVDSITADAARISFNEPTVTAFDVAYGPKGFNPDAEDADIKTNCTENPYSLEGLAADTQYEVYLRARNGELVSDWTNFSKSFRTKCLPVDMSASTMFVEDFESYNVDGSDFGCWSKSTTFYVEDYGYFYDASYNTVYISAVDGEKWAYTTSSPAYMFRAVELKAGENYSLSVYARDCYTSTSYVCNVSLGLATEPSTSAMNKLTTQTITKCGNAWDFVETFFTVEEDGVYYIAFGTEGSYNTLFDKVELKKHDIIPPTVEVAAVTSSSATFAITSNASAWDFYYSTEEFDPATLAEDITVTPLNEKTYTLEGLNAQTVYYYTFRAKEGDKVSGWSNVKFFQTACAEHALPFVEDFESFDGGCWNIETNDPAGSFKWAINDTYSQEEFENADVVGHAMRVSYSRNEGSKTILATPTLAFAENTDYRIEFNVRRNNQYSGDTGEGIAVYLSNQPVVNAESTMLTIVPRLKGETSADLGFADCLYPIGTIEIPEGGYVFQHITLDFNTADYAGKNYVIFEAVTYYGGEQYMDNITIAERVLEAPAAPVFSPMPGEGEKYVDVVNVTLTCETVGASILYAVDAEVNLLAPVYDGTPIELGVGVHEVQAASILLDEFGNYIPDAEDMPYMSEIITVTYIVEPGTSVDVDNTELLAMVYAKGGMVYVDTEVGNMIEVFTVQGQRIYAGEATVQLTTIDALNAEVVLVKVNGNTIKVAIK